MPQRAHHQLRQHRAIFHNGFQGRITIANHQAAQVFASDGVARQSPHRQTMVLCLLCQRHIIQVVRQMQTQMQALFGATDVGLQT